MATGPDYSWRRKPLGDEVEQFLGGVGRLEGYARALANWNRIIELLGASPQRSQFQLSLSSAQYHSFQILQEWWDGGSQAKCLSEAARRAIEEAAQPDKAESQNLEIDRPAFRTQESTYHRHMSLLFELEFVKETRILQQDDFITFLGLVHAQRERCGQFAALQRIAHSVLMQSQHVIGYDDKVKGKQTTRAESEVARTLPEKLQDTIGACVEACPWLVAKSVNDRSPKFLWDVVKRRTIIVDELSEPPSYICVSHTWGRWREEEKPPLAVPGVPWPIPQNRKFLVENLPNELGTAFSTGFVWFDLLCIPQDRSETALKEISRQAVIFGQATSVVAWLNDIKSWSGVQSVVEWLSLFYLHTGVAVSDGSYQIPELPDPYDTDYEPLELYLWDPAEVLQRVPADDSGQVEIAPPVPWFSSLWTLQEACLRPDLALCNRFWEPLTVGSDTVVTLDHLVTLDNYISRRTYKSSVIKSNVEVSQSEDNEFAEIEKPPGCYDLSTLMTDTCMSELIWASPSAIFTFGQLRQCKRARAEAIMSVVGATSWFDDHVAKYKTAPSEKNLVLGLYPLAFLNEAASKLGPLFYTSIPTDLRFLSSAVKLENGKWDTLTDPKAIGSLLPITSSPTYLIPPQQFSFASDYHPAVQEWKIQEDGSVRITKAGILTFGDEENVEKDNNDQIHAPLADEEGLSFDTELDTLEEADLEDWLNTFADPSSSPNYAVCLYQQIYLNRDIPGPQVGILLKHAGKVGTETRLVKVGIYFTRASRAWDISTKDVNWVVL